MYSKHFPIVWQQSFLPKYIRIYHLYLILFRILTEYLYFPEGICSSFLCMISSYYEISFRTYKPLFLPLILSCPVLTAKIFFSYFPWTRKLFAALYCIRTFGNTFLEFSRDIYIMIYIHIRCFLLWYVKEHIKPLNSIVLINKVISVKDFTYTKAWK